ncbi:hypothetical protein ACFFQF_29290, partial [Haladaptatus pallidirubidus]
DNSGNSAIDPTLHELVGDNTTIIFPPGTYLLNELVVYSGIDNLQLIAPNGARLIPGQSGDSIRWFDVYSNGFVLDGFELDMRETEIPPFVRMNNEAGNWELKRLVTRGRFEQPPIPILARGIQAMHERISACQQQTELEGYYKIVTSTKEPVNQLKQVIGERFSSNLERVNLSSIGVGSNCGEKTQFMQKSQKAR